MAKKYSNLDKYIVSWIKDQTKKSKSIIKIEPISIQKNLEAARKNDRLCKTCFYCIKKDPKNWKFLKNCFICRWSLFAGTEFNNSVCGACSDKYELCSYCCGERV